MHNLEKEKQAMRARFSARFFLYFFYGHRLFFPNKTTSDTVQKVKQKWNGSGYGNQIISQKHGPKQLTKIEEYYIFKK